MKIRYVVSRERKSWKGRPQCRSVSWGYEFAVLILLWVTEQVAFLQLRLCVCDMGIDPCSESFIKIKEDNSYKAACVTSTIYKGLEYTVVLLLPLFSILWGRG